MLQQKNNGKRRTFACLNIIAKQHNKYPNNNLLKIAYIYMCEKCHIVLLRACLHCSPSQSSRVRYCWLK